MIAARQVIRFLAKDVRAHALGIGLVLVLNVVLALILTETWPEGRIITSRKMLISATVQSLLAVAWLSLVGRVVQDDGVAGKASYWLTRPCSRPALLASKLAFVLLFLHAPSFLGQLVIVSASGVPLSLPQLLGNQALLAACLSLPLAAAAALTTTFSRFVAAGVGVIVFQLYLYGEIFDGSATVPIAVALGILALIAGVALACQYRWRLTLRVAAGSIVALSLLGLGGVTLPYYYDFLQRARAAVIGPPTVPPTIRLLDASERDASTRDARYAPPLTPPSVSLPLDTPFTGDTILRDYEIEVLAAAGREIDLVEWGGRLRQTGGRLAWLDLPLSPDDYDSLKGSFVSVRLAVEFGTLESREMEPIPLDGSFAIVDDRAQCGMSTPITIICRSSFGRSLWQLDDSRTEARLRWWPVRLNFALSPIEINQFGTRPQDPFAGASIATSIRQPVNYTRQEVTLEDIRLSDWAP